MLKLGLYVMGKSHTIDKYYQILSMFARFREIRNVDIKILLEESPDESNGKAADKDLYNTLQDEYDFINLSEVSINDLSLNAVFVIDPYSIPKTPYRDFRVPIIYKEYGVAGCEAGSGYLINKSVYKYADMIITENEFMKDKILQKYPDKYVVVGSPAFDYVFDFKNKVLNSWDPLYRNVLWTPHHSIDSREDFDKIEGGTYSNFIQYKDYLTGEFLEKFPDVTLHIKPHPILPKRFNAHQKSLGLEETYIQWKNKVKSDRVIFHEKEDYHKLFESCDVLLNDSISFTLEWLPTNKPLIALRNNSKYSEFGEELINKCYFTSYSSENLKDIYKGLREGSLTKKDNKEEINKLYINSSYRNSDALSILISRRYE